MLRGMACALITTAWVLPAQAQIQSPTIPKPTPSLSKLREQLRNKGVSNKGQAPSNTAPTGAARPQQSRETPQPGTPQRGQPQRPTPPGARKPAAGPGVSPITAGKGKETKAGRTTGVRGGTGGQGAATVHTLGEGIYDPIMDMPIEYKDVPDEGEPFVVLNGPMTVEEFIETLAMATEWNVIATEEALAVNLQFWITNMKPKDALEVLRFHDLYYEFDETTRYFTVMTKDEYLERTYGDTEECEIVVEHASVEYIESVITALLSPKGRAIIDARTQHIFLWDTNENIEKIQETVAKLDTPLEQAEFTIEHAEIADIETILTAMLSPAGNLTTDPRTSTIVVSDLKDIIAKMQSAVERFDVPLESRTFNIKYISVDSLTDSIESLLTERGIVQADPRSNTIVVTDLPTRQDQIAEIIEALDKELESRTWVINYVEPEDVAERLETLVPEEMGDIVVDEDVHQVTVTAVPERIEQIDKLIKAWDVKRRQVQIEAYLVSVGSPLARNLDITWSYFDNGGNTPQAYRINGGAAPNYADLTNNVTIGKLPFAETLRNPFSGDIIQDINAQDVVDRFHGSKIAAIIDYLDTNNQATVLSSPRVTVQDGEEASFQSGRQVPYMSSSSYGSGYGSSYRRNLTSTSGDTTGTNTNTNANYNYGGYGGYGGYNQPYNRVDFIEVGTILKVLPRITEDNSILLELSAEDSDATSVKVVSQGEENTIPEKTENVAETMVRVQDGQTIVIGGLRKGNATNNLSKSVPFLSDIPLLGRIFRNPTRNVKNDTLLIFITTTIVDEYTKPESERLAQLDKDFSDKMRNAQKTSFGRLFEGFMRSKDEIGISIGQHGHIYCAGEHLTMDELREKLQSVDKGLARKIVIRKHSAAPEKIITEIMEIALEVGLKIEYDYDIVPFVPDYDSLTPPGADPNPPPEELPEMEPVAPETSG